MSHVKRLRMTMNAMKSGELRSKLSQSVSSSTAKADLQAALSFDGPGFHVFEGTHKLSPNFRISRVALENLSKHPKWSPVLNDLHENAHGGGSGGRFQLARKDCPVSIQDIVDHYLRFVQTLSDGDSHLKHSLLELQSVSHLLKSNGEVENKDQSLHLDAGKKEYSIVELIERPQFKQAFTATSMPPCSIIIPLHNDIELRVIRGSHRAVWRMKVNEQLKVENIVIRVGEIFIFRQDLIHGGVAYKECNIRLHVYLDHVNIGHFRIRGPNVITGVEDVVEEYEIEDGGG